MTYDDGSLFEEEFDFVDDDLDSDLESASDEDQAKQADQEEKKSAPASPKRRPARKASSRGNRASASSAEEEKASDKKGAGKKGSDKKDGDTEPQPAEAVPAGPPADHVVHLYEFGSFQRTIAREFTSEDASAFVEEFNRTSTPHGRLAVAASRDAEPAPTVGTQE